MYTPHTYTHSHTSRTPVLILLFLHLFSASTLLFPTLLTWCADLIPSVFGEEQAIPHLFIPTSPPFTLSLSSPFQMASSPKHSPSSGASQEDPDTAAARKELKQTAISEKPDLTPMPSTTNTTSQDAPAPSSETKSADNISTPPDADTDVHDDAVKEQLASPKKKRAHDEMDKSKDVTNAEGTKNTSDRDVSPIGDIGGTSLSRTDRSEPEKKRPRDFSSESKVDSSQLSTEPLGAEKTASNKEETATASEKLATEGEESKKTTSKSAFLDSGFAAFTSSASPFAQAESSKPLTSFASASSTFSSSTTASPFASASSSAKNVFGGEAGQSNGFAAFGSAGASLSVFGNKPTKGAFGSAPPGRLNPTSFGKAAKPFGAPVSDEEDEASGSDENNPTEDDKESEHQNEQEDSSGKPADKKKSKLTQVETDDGEDDEVTVFSFRARLYQLDKASQSWKERGIGNLKLNFPIVCMTLDANGQPILGTFNAAALKETERVVRLLMRQDSTHRVILNTAIIPAMKLEVKSNLKATFILFQALESDGPVSMQMKVSDANADRIIKEIQQVQRELQSV
ncbi:hypothetical protein F5Y16DRAFT_263404 [Xylariaceae sp. FL0255]|nr:hypothetical protein F5Y16DRAFT_263404 [Xylariaceae sp. FL0255]